SYSRSARVIGPPILAQLASLTRPVAPWWSLRRKSPLCPRENSLTEDAPFPFDVDCQDATVFHQHAESRLDEKLERWDRLLSDPGPVTVSWDPETVTGPGSLRSRSHRSSFSSRRDSAC